MSAASDGLERLAAFGQEVTGQRTADGVVMTLARHAAQVTDAQRVEVAMYRAEPPVLLVHGFDGGSPVRETRLDIDDVGSEVARTFRDWEERLIGNTWLCPLEAAGAHVGVLAVSCSRPDAFGPGKALALRAMASYVGIALANVAARREADAAEHELRHAQSEIERIANTDPLTGLANRRSFLAAAHAEASRSVRYGRSLGLIIADIDQFKAINERRGHACGDHVIVSAARVLNTGRRAIDSLGRIGGEEFALLLPEADVPTALGATERLRLAIEKSPAVFEGARIPFTMSFGAAVLEGSVASEMDAAHALEALVSRADAALSEAKSSGRNRACGRVVAGTS
jgi:diguanylate cyclase (GGDEF)-like protein